MSRESERRAEREQRRTADQASAAAETPKEKRTSPAQFLGEVRSELRKVAWPGRKEVGSYTVVVLIVSTILTLLVWGMDYVIRNAVINTLG
jgi:preprotein translocase subunit SecE